MEDNIAIYHRSDMELIDSSGKPIPINWMAGFSESDIINNKVPSLFIILWTLALSASTFFDVSTLMDSSLDSISGKVQLLVLFALIVTNVMLMVIGSKMGLFKKRNNETAPETIIKRLRSCRDILIYYIYYLP